MYKLILSTFTALLVAAIISPSATFAAKNSATTSANSLLGNDISYPQCNKTWPKNQAFGIVGVNGGLATNTNPCLKEQLVWASHSTGISNQEKIQVYINTANPGGLGTPSWPSWGSSDNPYGNCDGSDNLACAWQYGWNRANESVNIRFIPAANQAKINPDPSKYLWWLDVETLNTWKPNNSDFNTRSNTAVIEGMAAYLKSKNSRVGLYSTAYQWGQIVGSSVGSASNLNGLPNWRPGGANLNTAKQACDATSLTQGGQVVLSQYIYKNLDYNYAC